MTTVKIWHRLVAMVLIFSVCFCLPSNHHLDPVEICWTAATLWEPLAMIPQAILYRRYRQVEGLTGASFLLLMGLYRLLGIANWIYRTSTEPHFRHHVLVYMAIANVAQVLVIAWGLFWPHRAQEQDLMVPLLNQTFQFCREVHWGILALLLVFVVVFLGQGMCTNPDQCLAVSVVSLLLLVLLVFVPPACFFYLFCDTPRALAPENDPETDAHDELSIPLMDPSLMRGADATLSEPTSLFTTSESQQQQPGKNYYHETPATTDPIVDNVDLQVV